MLRMTFAVIFVASFVGIFVDRLVRGPFDIFSLIFVCTAAGAYFANERLYEHQRKEWLKGEKARGRM